METTKMSNFTCESKSFINIFSTCQVSACELQPFSCHTLANDIYSETAKTVFSHLKHLYHHVYLNLNVRANIMRWTCLLMAPNCKTLFTSAIPELPRTVVTDASLSVGGAYGKQLGLRLPTSMLCQCQLQGDIYHCFSSTPLDTFMVPS